MDLPMVKIIHLVRKQSVTNYDPLKSKLESKQEANVHRMILRL